MSPSPDSGDYLLGTGDAELERLGLQHRVWRPWVLQAWQRAGITNGSRVLDVGAGPGYAAVDLAEIVGTEGEVLAVERSVRFVRHARALSEARGLRQLRVLEQDLMADPLPELGFDVAWCRWVACFVDAPAKLVDGIARALRKGGRVVFHEYGDYETWRLAPAGPELERFVAEVVASWRASGGEPDVGRVLPALLTEAGFRVLDVRPLVFAAGPDDYIWRWPAAFVHSGLRRLLDLRRIDAPFAQAVLTELGEAERDRTSLMITPLLLEITAELG
jgi:SAM-dependent methyltransferase